METCTRCELPYEGEPYWNRYYDPNGPGGNGYEFLCPTCASQTRNAKRRRTIGYGITAVTLLIAWLVYLWLSRSGGV